MKVEVIDDEWSNDESIISNSGDTPNDQINIELNYSLISDDSLIDDSDHESTYRIGLYKQLYDVRQLCHDKYMSEKLQTNRFEDVIENNGNVNANEKWPPNTALIVGDSMISGVIEKKMRIKNTRVKVRSFPGAKINDFYHYLVPLLKKEPDTVIFHCGTNDIIDKNPEEILDGLLQLKTYIHSLLPSANVVISQPIIRNDNLGASVIVGKVRDYLNELKCECISHNNINFECLGKGKLHLNGRGSGRMAMNFKSYIQCL